LGFAGLAVYVAGSLIILAWFLLRFDVTRFGYHFIMSFTGLFLVFFAQTVFLLLSCTHISWGIYNKSFFLGNGVRFQVVFARCSVVFLMHPFYRFFDALQSAKLLILSFAASVLENALFFASLFYLRCYVYSLVDCGPFFSL